MTNAQQVLKTDSADEVTEALLLALRNGIAGMKHMQAQKGRSEADKQYFLGGFDSLDMLARKLAESGLVDREAFLKAVGCIA